MGYTCPEESCALDSSGSSVEERCIIPREPEVILKVSATEAWEKGGTHKCFKSENRETMVSRLGDKTSKRNGDAGIHR